MPQVIIDPTTQQQLLASGDRVTLCDQTGKMIGYFVPAKVPPHVLEWANKEITVDEIERARSEPGGCTTEELLKKLEEL